MGLTDVIVIAVVAVLLALAVRSVVRGKAGECSSCGSRGRARRMRRELPAPPRATCSETSRRASARARPRVDDRAGLTIASGYIVNPLGGLTI